MILKPWRTRNYRMMVSLVHFKTLDTILYNFEINATDDYTDENSSLFFCLASRLHFIHNNLASFACQYSAHKKISADKIRYRMFKSVNKFHPKMQFCRKNLPNKSTFLNPEFYFIYQSANISINYLLIVGSWIVALKFIEFIFHHYINISHSVDFYVVQAFTSHMDHIDHMIWPIWNRSNTKWINDCTWPM